ncbi:MAG: IS66 family transposase [Acidobacteriaceae bacterium]|jgi:transposase
MVLAAEVEALIASLRAEIAALRAEVADLRRQLGRDSSNSWQPPSSDGLRKKPRIGGSLRGRSGKTSGGQTGHKGGTLRQVADPDCVVGHAACACGHCGWPLEAGSAIGVEKRQVFDLPERPLLVTEHQASIYRCAHCRGVTKAAFPEGVVSPTQYGERIKAAAIYLNVQQLIPEDRTAQALSDLFGAPLICPASLVAWVAEKGQELRQVYQAIGERAAEAKVRHLDETGFRIAGKLQWLHTTSSQAFTFYRASERRGAIPQDLKGGVVVHDHFLPYRRLDAVDHAFCNAHILRELQCLIEFDKEPWAELMRDALLAANIAVHEARGAGAKALEPEVIAAFVDQYWAAVRLGLAFHRQLPALQAKANASGRTKQRPGRNLLERLKTFKTETLRFLTDFDVPFTNNLAEQDLRMMKVKMKISGSFRTLDGAQTFARLRSVVSTARKQGANILKTLADPPTQIALALNA